MYAVLDMTDENWEALFSVQERQEIQGTTETSFDYPSLPLDMEQFLRDIPNTNNLNDIYRHLEACPLDPESEAHLVFLKFCLQASLLLFKSNYFPIANHKERDICTNVWHIFGKAFNDSVLNLEIEQASNASKEVNNKRRKIAANSQMSRQRRPLIPDMAMLQGEQEYAIIEVSKCSNNTKQIKEGEQKYLFLMLNIFNQVLTTSPTEQCSIRVYGCLLSRLNCMLLQLSSPQGYVKVFKRGNLIKHPGSLLIMGYRLHQKRLDR